MAGAALLFVYGTLLDPRRLREVVGAECRCRVLGPGWVPGRLYDLGAWPALRPGRRPADRVPGLVVEIAPAGEALRRLDEYEDVDEGVFRRRQTRVERPGQPPLRAWVYEYARPVRGRRRIAGWKSGSSSPAVAAVSLTRSADGA